MNSWKPIPFLAAVLVAQGQVPTPMPMNDARQEPTQPVRSGSVPLYQVMVVQGSAKAINYRDLKSSTKVDLKGTVLSPAASGVASIESEHGGIEVNAKVKNMPPAATFGGEYLTYVLWGISTEGRATNLGEILLKNGKGKLKVMEPLQTFGLIVTAEPYFAVSQPSDAVVLENVVRKDTQGQVELIDAKYELLKRGQYTLNLASTEPMVMDDKTPFAVYQARNAVRIAQAAGAQTYAPDALSKAEGYLQQSENTQGATKDRAMMAKESIQRAEDARLISVQRQAADQVATDKKRSQDQLTDAQQETAMANAGQDAARRDAATANAGQDAARRDAATATAGQDAARRDAATANAGQDAARRDAATANAGQDAARRDAATATAGQDAANDQARMARNENESLQSKNEGLQSKNEGLQSKNEGLQSRNEGLRAQLMEQLNAILQTRATARGLIVNMSGVLFQNGKAMLLPTAREKLSKIAGILSGHPGLKIEADGFTDSRGSEDFNLSLSERRAQAARDYLVSQGVSADAVTFKGFGKESPIASNATTAGRQENRRVELVVSGEGITDQKAAGL